VADPLIRVANLYKVFGSHPKSIMAMVHEGCSKDEIRSETGHALALKGINLNIEASEIFVIMGLSGSGKSTLIRHLNRLIEATEGTIHIGDIDVMNLSQTELETFRQRRMSMVFQRFALLPHRTAVQNVAFGLTIQKQPKKDRDEKAREWLQAVGLDGYEECYPAELSGGEQQRVGLARALCTDPDILLMDEAFSALDPLIRSEMQDQLIDLHGRLKKTIVFITHDLDEALRLGDRIAILKDGEISQVGKPQDILDNPADDYVAAFVRDVKRSRSPKAPL
jgi:glycine betaine/proline transport system ATP-binding protein